MYVTRDLETLSSCRTLASLSLPKGYDQSHLGIFQPWATISSRSLRNFRLHYPPTVTYD